MGAMSIGVPHGSNTVQLDGSSFQNRKSYLVCFLSHCYGLPTNSSHHCAARCRGCEIRRELGIRLCRTRSLRPARTMRFSVRSWLRCFSPLPARPRQELLTLPALLLLTFVQ